MTSQDHDPWGDSLFDRETILKRNFEKIHKGTALVLLVDALIVAWITTQFLALVITSSSTLLIVAFLLFSVLLQVWAKYRNKKKSAYGPASIIFSVAALYFGILTLNNIYYGLTGNITFLFIALLMGYVCFNTIGRVRMHSKQWYRDCYNGTFEIPETELSEGEMLAACPSCMAILAIVPTQLSTSDRCPHCNNYLVTQDREEE